MKMSSLEKNVLRSVLLASRDVDVTIPKEMLMSLLEDTQTTRVEKLYCHNQHNVSCDAISVGTLLRTENKVLLIKEVLVNALELKCLIRDNNNHVENIKNIRDEYLKVLNLLKKHDNINRGVSSNSLDINIYLK